MHETTSLHRQAWDLIPWIVNGSAEDSERSAVESHLATCADCREELEFQHQLYTQMTAAGGVATDPLPGWERLRAQLGDHNEVVAAEPEPRRLVRRHAIVSWQSWAVAALVVQAIGLGALGTALWSRQPGTMPATHVAVDASAGYRTLAATPASAGPATIRAVFESTMTLAQLQGLLAKSHLQVVAGPGNDGIWSLAPASDVTRMATAATLRELRASPAVRFAEGVATGP